jgi:hypothetical protein
MNTLLLVHGLLLHIDVRAGSFPEFSGPAKSRASLVCLPAGKFRPTNTLARPCILD